MTGPRPDESPRGRIDAELRRHLVLRLLSAPVVQVVAPISVVVLCVILLLGRAPTGRLVGWAAAVILATTVRLHLPHRIRAAGLEGDAALVRFRAAVLASALAWGAGPLLVLQQASIDHIAIVAMVFAGIVAAATATLVADRASFHLFTITVLSPLAVAILLHGLDREHVLMASLVALFGMVASVVHRHAFEQLVDLLRTSRRLRTSERQAAHEKAFLDALFRSAPVAIVAVAEGARVLKVNPAFESLFGYSASEAQGRTINELIVPPARRAESREIDEELARTGTVTFETRRMARDGRPIDVRIAGALASGEATGAGFVIYDDITDRKRAENEVREHEAQYRLLVESMSDLVWQADTDGRWTFLNEACREIYGHPPDRLLGRPMADSCAPERREADTERFRRLLAGEMMFDCETVHLRADGTRVNLSFAGRPVRDAESRVVGAQGTARDVTVRARIHAELARARQEAERTAAARSSFVANVSHEIRTPMNGVIGITDLLLDSELGVEQRRSVELIRTSAESLLAVINDILDFSRIEAGRVSIDAEPFDLHGLVDSAVRLLATRATEKSVELRYEIDRAVPRAVISDPARIRQILNNLIGNAVKFTAEGEIEVRVRAVSADGADSTIAISVRDTGIGIDEDKLSTIFEEFSQVDMTITRRFGGTGLGLAIARRLTRALGGDLTVRSQPGRGSEFVATMVVRTAGCAVRPAMRSGADLAGRRALIVDDNSTNRRVFRDMLRTAGMHVAVARSAESALAMLRRAIDAGRRVDIILIDSHMPDRDGFDFAADVRAEPALETTQVMMLTSGGRPGDGQRCRDLGVDGYLTKPFSRSELLEAVVAVLADTPGQRGTRLITRHSIEETRRRIRILLVEDNAVNREVAATMLRRRGHEVDIATNGREAVDAVLRASYDVVLMDIQMPVLDGLAATREIRAMPERAGLRIVALTAHALADEKRRCLDAGMDGYLSKPFRPHELFAIIENWGTTAGPGPDPTGSSAPIDLAAFRSSLKEAGIEDSLDALLNAFATDAPGRLDAIEAACGEGDAAAIAATAHALKSAAGTIAAQPLAELLRQAELAGREDDVERARTLCRDLRPAVGAVLDLIAGMGAEIGA